MKVNELLTQIKNNNINPIYLVLGKEDYLINEIKKHFVELIPEEERTMNFASYDMESQNIATAVGDAESLPFFGEKRLVVVNNPYFLTGERSKSTLDHDIDSFIDYVNHPVDSTVMVIMAPYGKLDSRKKVTKQLKNNAEVIDLTKLDDRAIQSYVANNIKSNGYTVEGDALQELLGRVSNDLSSAMNELPKLLLYCQKDKVITKESIDSLVAKSLDQNVFDLIDYVMKKDSKNAIDLYHNLIVEDQEPLQINAVLLSQFRLLLQVNVLSRKGYSQGNIAEKLKVHPFRVKLAMQNVRKYQFSSLRDAYLGLVDVEEKLKSTPESPELLFQMFTLKFVDNQIG